MALTVTASDGTELPEASLAVAYTYVTIGSVNKIQTATVEYTGNTYVKTFTYNGDGCVSNVSMWVLQ